MSKKKAIIYCRVSTPKQSQEGESLTQQAQACKRLAENRDCAIVQTFTDTYSGKSLDRPGLNKLFAFVASNKVDFVFIRDIDRLTRGGGGDYDEIKNRLSVFGVDLVDSSGFIQPSHNLLEPYGFEETYDWSLISPTEIAEKMRADIAKEERKTILRRLIPAEIELVRNGYHIGIPNYGFVSKQIFVDGKQKFILEPDPKSFGYFYEMFEMRVNGFTDEEIVTRVNNMGFRSRVKRKWNNDHTQIIGHTGGNKLTVKQLQKYICNPRYAGINIHKWTNYKPIKTKGGFIVSIDKFNVANKGKIFIRENLDGSVDVLYDYSPTKNTKRRMRHNPNFPIKSLVHCPECDKPLKGSASTGKSGNRFFYYHCERGHKGFRVPKDELESKYYNFLETIGFDGANKDALRRVLTKTWSMYVEQSNMQSERIQCEIEELLHEKNKVVKKIIATENQTVQTALESRLDEIEEQIQQLKNNKQKAMLSEGSIEEFLQFAMQVVEHPAKMLKMTEDADVQEVISSLYFEATPTYADILNRTPQMSVIYKICEASQNEKSLNVARRGIEPLLPG